jgi:hypothetical protein
MGARSRTPATSVSQRPFVFALKMGDICRGAAHVKANESGYSLPADWSAPHLQSPGRARQDAVFALEKGGIGEAAVGLHEHQAWRGGVG